MTTPSSDVARDVGHAAIRSAPPLAVWVLHLNDVFVLLSSIYVAVQLGYLLWKWRREWKSRRGSDDA